MNQHTVAYGRWHELTLAEQLGNVGSEFERAMKWKKQNDPRFQKALERYLELLDLTVVDPRLDAGRKRELLSLHESSYDALTNSANDDMGLSNYFYHFALLARRGK